jgi:hypothetical protein
MLTSMTQFISGKDSTEEFHTFNALVIKTGRW